MTVLQDLSTMSHEQIQAEVLRLRAENHRLAQPKGNLKVSQKGAVSLYGMGRFPITLYREQWERVLGMKDEIEAFILANMDKLSTKGED